MDVEISGIPLIYYWQSFVIFQGIWLFEILKSVQKTSFLQRICLKILPKILILRIIIVAFFGNSTNHSGEVRILNFLIHFKKFNYQKILRTFFIFQALELHWAEPQIETKDSGMTQWVFCWIWRTDAEILFPAGVNQKSGSCWRFICISIAKSLPLAYLVRQNREASRTSNGNSML